MTTKGHLLACCQAVVQEVVGVIPELSTSGGTSDGRFVSPTGAEVVEFGVCNDTIHQLNERVKIIEIDLLSEIYEKLMVKLLT